jgi:hypothetical protein
MLFDGLKISPFLSVPSTTQASVAPYPNAGHATFIASSNESVGLCASRGYEM